MAIFTNSNIEEELPALVSAEDGSALDLTGRTLFLGMEYASEPGKTAIQFSTDDGSLELKAGTTNVLIAKRVFDGDSPLRAGQYRFDVVEVLSAGLGQVRIGGGSAVVVNRGITHP